MASTPLAVFTEEVQGALAELRGLISHITRREEDRQRLHDAVAVVASKFEEQVLLMFNNFALHDKMQPIQLLQRETHEAIEKARWHPGVGATQELKETDKQESEVPPDTQSDTIDNRSNGQRVREKPRVDKRKAGPLEATQRHLSCGMYMALEALAGAVKAERCTVYIHHKTTNVLKAVCTVPPTLKKIQVSAHSGLLGLSFTSSVAFNLKIGEDDRITYVKPIDQQLGTVTHNVLCFPIRNPNSHTIGILEVANKMRGSAPWSDLDESIAFHTAPIFGYLMSHYEQADVFSLPSFDASSSLHVVEPWAPAMEDQHTDVPTDVKTTDGRQLVFRNGPGNELANSFRGFRDQTMDKSQVMITSGPLKEVYSYLVTLEESYKQGLNQYAQSEKERQKLQEEIQRRSHKIRILEENVAYLEDIIKELKAHDNQITTTRRRSHFQRASLQRGNEEGDTGRDREATDASAARAQGGPAGGPPEQVKRVVMLPATRDPSSPKLPQVPPKRAGASSAPTALTPATLAKFLKAKELA